MATQYTIPAGRYGDTSTAFIQAYIDQEIANVVDLAPETLNSLNELAAAINDDPAFFATVAGQVSELNTDVTDVVAALGGESFPCVVDVAPRNVADHRVYCRNICKTVQTIAAASHANSTSPGACQPQPHHGYLRHGPLFTDPRNCRV